MNLETDIIIMKTLFVIWIVIMFIVIPILYWLGRKLEDQHEVIKRMIRVGSYQVQKER